MLWVKLQILITVESFHIRPDVSKQFFDYVIIGLYAFRRLEPFSGQAPEWDKNSMPTLIRNFAAVKIAFIGDKAYAFQQSQTSFLIINGDWFVTYDIGSQFHK